MGDWGEDIKVKKDKLKAKMGGWGVCRLGSKSI